MLIDSTNNFTCHTRLLFFYFALSGCLAYMFNADTVSLHHFNKITLVISIEDETVGKKNCLLVLILKGLCPLWSFEFINI
tara:strand:- start:681 stop:920 length:240 start_codon:yes stop_codon:yes gene_type:complete